MASYLRLIHNGVMKTVALYDGIDQNELNSLLTTVFGITGKIVGVMGEKGLVVPLSLVCKAPEVAPNSVCKILVVGGGNNANSNNTVVSDNVSQIPQVGTSVTSEAMATDDNSQAVSEEDSVEYVTQEITRFLNGLKSQKFLNLAQFKRLMRLLTENSNLLFAAYSVAISANDSEYFAEICKDIANSLESEQGRIACEAQDEVLQICDQLYINDKITENQLLYLRHLVLIREEAVATLYDEFQEHQSIPLLAKALYELANTHPFQTLSEADGEQEEEEEEEEEEEPVAEEEEEEEDVEIPSPAVPKRKSSATSSKGLTGVIALMSRSGLLSKTESSVLYEMVEQENDYVLAAYELYERDKNLEDLQDTLIRCAKLEIRKRVTEIQEKELEAMQKERQQQEEEDEEDEDEEEQEESDEDDVDEDNLNQNSVDDEDDNKNEEDISLEDISLPTILQSLSVDNIWEKSVPEGFIKAVFIAVIRNQLTLAQAKNLCDLFHARYDLVHAAWEVFTVQRDATDFIDTMRRIVRDVNVDEMRQQVQKDLKSGQSASSSESPSQKPADSRPSSAASTSKNSPAKANAPSPNNPSSEAASLQERKAEALLAVNAAKRELLKHSLEMMVKQKMTTAEKAADLYSRYLNGDVLTDAAIEAYAADRDVGEFLDTLQVLANNSKEDLDILMKAVATENEDQQPEANEKDAAQTASEDIALSQIDEIVNEMLKSDMIGPGIAEEFRKLIRAREQKLIDAYNTYQENKSGAELVNTLLKIVIAAVEGAPKASTTTASNPSTRPQSANNNSNNNNNASPASDKRSPAKASPAQQRQEEEDDEQQAALDPSDQKTVVEILIRAKAIDQNQYQTLISLIDSGSKEIAKIFSRYEESKDVYGLIDALKGINLSQTSGKKQEEDEEEDDQDDNEQEDEEDEEEYDQDFDEEDGVAIEDKFMQIIQNMQLTDLETAALRLAIAENDPAIRTAIDNFRSDLDEENLMNAMKGAARSVITRTLSSRMGRAFDRGGEEYDQEAENDEEDNKNVAESKAKESKQVESKQATTSPIKSPNAKSNSPMNYDEEFDEIEDLDDEGDDDEEDDEESNDDEDDDGEEEDEEEDRKNESKQKNDRADLLVTQSARDHIFPILVQELVKENIINKQSGRIILQEFASSNPAITQALDAYDQDNDMAQLVESLQDLVESVSSN